MRLNTIGKELVGAPKAYRLNPIYPGMMYAMRQPKFGYYGAIGGGGGTVALNKQTVFSVAQGQNYTVAGAAAPILLTNWHTNLLSQPSQLPNPERLYIKQVSGFLDNGTLEADAKAFSRNTLVTLFMGNDVKYWQSHFFKIPAMGGLNSGSSGIINNGWPSQENRCDLWSPAMQVGTSGGTFGATGPQNPMSDMFGPVTVRGCEILEQGQNFGVVLDPTLTSDATATTTYTTSSSGIGINAWIYLDGIWMRGLQ